MTINLELYQKLDDRQKLEYILLNGDKLVNIYSGQHAAYWRADYKGYSTDLKAAGVYQLSDAIAATQHCGPEKKIKYHFVAENVISEKPVWEDVEDILNDVNVSFDRFN